MDRVGQTFTNLTGEEADALLQRNPIYVAYRGSHAHGTYVPPMDPQSIDDVDVISCYIPPLEAYFGIEKASRGKQVQIKQWDSACYEIRHFVGLVANANPDVMQSLWVRPEDHILVYEEGRMLLENRGLFTSKRVAASFGGYARGQLHRMTAFHDSGEATCCDGEKFHTPECKLTKERGRGSAKKFATGFMGAKRKALVEKYGYDTKNAAHLIRLLRMGIEFLETGQLHVYRIADRDQLIDIKAGGYSLRAVQQIAAEHFSRLEEAEAKSKLPEHPDMAKINKLLVDILCVSKESEVALAALHAKTVDGLWQR